CWHDTHPLGESDPPPDAGRFTTITVSGPGTSESYQSNTCRVANPGQNFRLPTPGQYTVTVTVAQPGHPDITEQITVTINPFN
ncbi:hypothetical protein ONR57_18165, partial [Hoyosella sp. YIM 151337]|nr:hypothetical protein [Hoyosella sp. YIM 151337]